MASLPRLAASWSDTPSGPGGPRHTTGACTHPCRGTPSTQARTSGCTAGWHRTSVRGAPQGPISVGVVDLANSYLKEKPRLTAALCLGFSTYTTHGSENAALQLVWEHKPATRLQADAWGQGLHRRGTRAPLCIHQLTTSRIFTGHVRALGHL